MTLSRLYLQCPLDDDIKDWSDDRIWSELHKRLGDAGRQRVEGKMPQKGITPMPSFVSGPMRHGRPFHPGDASPTVPPTGKSPST